MIVYDYFVAWLCACAKRQGIRSIIGVTGAMAFLSPFVFISLFFDILHWIGVNYYISGLLMTIIGIIISYFSYDIFIKINLNRVEKIEKI